MQEFYETVQRQQEYEEDKMKWLERFLDETADQLVCTHCESLKGEATQCCDDKSWKFFKDLPLEKQMEIAKQEWELL